MFYFAGKKIRNGTIAIIVVPLFSSSLIRGESRIIKTSAVSYLFIVSMKLS